MVPPIHLPLFGLLREHPRSSGSQTELEFRGRCRGSSVKYPDFYRLRGVPLILNSQSSLPHIATKIQLYPLSVPDSGMFQLDRVRFDPERAKQYRGGLVGDQQRPVAHDSNRRLPGVRPMQQFVQRLGIRTEFLFQAGEIADDNPGGGISPQQSGSALERHGWANAVQIELHGEWAIHIGQWGDRA